MEALPDAYKIVLIGDRAVEREERGVHHASAARGKSGTKRWEIGT